jgi:hypothetical protein
MAGLGLSCSHVGALLWNIEYAVKNNMTVVSCTDGIKEQQETLNPSHWPVFSSENKKLEKTC